ncbi:hypothetical protein [Sorangium sp. So ce542]|uniref:hypothetical protein n=1 Tax=Sorangium sp. So ce542 TaxID=3133316 RepID=UPI003F6128FC
MNISLLILMTVAVTPGCEIEDLNTDTAAAAAVDMTGATGVLYTSDDVAESGAAPESNAGAGDELCDEVGSEAESLGKQCWADCTVVNVGAASCPSTIGGYGETKFLGGCKKACRRARGDAASKLPPGCKINNCSTSGC